MGSIVGKKLVLALALVLIGLNIPSDTKAFPTFPPYVHADITWADKRDFLIGLDKNTGTIYNFTNKRSDPNANTIHGHQGAALQVAIHQGGLNSLTENGCSLQGYWNPTQAGAACNTINPSAGHMTPRPGTDYQVLCDGVQNTNCATVSNSLEQTYFRMMNFDYGPNYQGPYNAGDTMYMKNKAVIKDNYVLVDYSLKNTGIERNNALIEMPTYYFSPNYRTYTYLSGKNIETANFPVTNELDLRLPNTGNFVTLEDPAKPNSAITVAWFADEKFAQDTTMVSDLTSNLLYISAAPFENTDYVKMRVVSPYNIKTNKEVSLRYVVIPYKYNENIQTEFGTMPVRDFIKKLDYPEESISVSLSSGQEYISPNYQRADMNISTNNDLFVGLKSGNSYTNNQSLGKAFTSNRKIKRIEFDYDSNYSNGEVFAAIDVPGKQHYYKFDHFGTGSGRQVSIEVPYSDWVAFGLYTKNNFTYSYPDNEWYFKVSNLKYYYYDNGITPTAPPTPTPTTQACPKKPQGDADCNNIINLSDFEVFRKEFNLTLNTKTADFNNSNSVTLVDFEIWRQNLPR